MPNLSKFKKENPVVLKYGDFPAEEIQKYKGKVPNEIIDLWQKEGNSSYADGYLRVVLPDEYHDIFKMWGMDGGDCYVFMRSALGSLIFTQGEDIFELDPQVGELEEMSSPKFFFEYSLGSYTDRGWSAMYKKYAAKLPTLKADEMLTLVPSIEAGGGPNKSVLEIVDFKAQHMLLADQYENYLMKEGSQDGVGDLEADSFDKLNVKFAIIACLNELGLYIEEADKILEDATYTRAYRRSYFGSVVPQMLDYYSNLEIPQEHLDQIVTFNPGVYMDIYGKIIKDWGGEEEYFYITKNLNGIEQLRHMEEFDGSEILQESPNISALLKCPSLKTVILGGIELTQTSENVVEKLRNKGVEVEE